MAYNFCPLSKIVAQKRLLDMIFEMCDTILSTIFKVIVTKEQLAYK